MQYLQYLHRPENEDSDIISVFCKVMWSHNKVVVGGSTSLYAQ